MESTIATLIVMFTAAAHVGDVLDTLDVHADASGSSEVHVQAAFGLVSYTGREAAWVCHEAVMADGVQAAPLYAQGSSGRFIAWTGALDNGRDGHPAWTSSDRCTWTPIPDLDGKLVASGSVRGDEPWFATATSNTINGLYRVDEAGGASLTGAASTDLFLSVHAEGPGVWALSSDGDALTVWSSHDGSSFSSSVLDVDDDLTRPLRGTIAAVDPEDPDRAWVVIDPIGTDLLVETTDGGATTSLVWEAPDRITDVERLPDGRLLVVLNDRRPWLQGESGFTELSVDDSAGVGSNAAGTWFSHRTYVTGSFLSFGTQPETADWTLGPSTIVAPLSCPDASSQAVHCLPLWDLLAPRLVPPQTADTGLPPAPTPAPTEDDDVQGPCGCGTPAPIGLPLLVAALAATLRRRRPLETA